MHVAASHAASMQNLEQAMDGGGVEVGLEVGMDAPAGVGNVAKNSAVHISILKLEKDRYIDESSMIHSAVPWKLASIN